MTWNWQKKEWPHFTCDSTILTDMEARFLHQAAVLSGTLRHLDEDDKKHLTVDLISKEAEKTSQIEGEILDRDSLQASIRKYFGLETDFQRIPPAEQGIAEMMVNLYRTFQKDLTHEQLFTWHQMLTYGRRDLKTVGAYRTHADPMQVVSGALDSPTVHFEAPPSKMVKREMERFINWFNTTACNGINPLPALTRSGIAHLYFVSIHPFEDGNGRIGRAIAEKALSQRLGRPTLIALSHIIQKYKKTYYSELEAHNKNLEITEWLVYFAKTVLESQDYTLSLIDFLIEKTKLFDRLRGKLNKRQEKVLLRMFREGPEGFKGGLSAENYIRIAKTSRATATRDLQNLVEKGALLKTGERKHTRYFLNVSTRLEY